MAGKRLAVRAPPRQPPGPGRAARTEVALQEGAGLDSDGSSGVISIDIQG